jgi:hypothetical protein
MDENQKLMIVETGFGSNHRRVILTIGKEYVGKSINPKKMRHRGRRVKLLNFVQLSKSHSIDTVAKVKFLDIGRIGRLDPCDVADDE